MAVCPTCGRDAGDASFCTFDGTPLAHVGRGPAAMPRIGDMIDDRYILLEELGRGGMAMVFLARSEALDREVAVKVLYPRWAEDRKTVARFAREARAASQIDHEAVVKVYDFGYSQQGFYFLAMERLDGQPLQHVLRSGRLAPVRAMPIMRSLAEGVARAHELGVIHRDLKPENVMHHRDGERDVITIVDFGLSKIQEGDAGLTGEGDVIGTPDFMAPEQWQGRPVDARADVYSFGIMAYELLSGELPFKGDSLIQKLQQHLNAQAPPLSEMPGGERLPEGLSELVAQCMKKDPAERPEHMGQVAAALKHIEKMMELRRSTPTALESAAPMATVMAPMDDASLGKLGLLTEVRRLTRVRQQRLLDAIGPIFEAGPPPAIAAVRDDITRAEAHLESAEQQLALAEASLKEAQRARRSKEAELRARLVAANLALAVARNALPDEVTDPYEAADTVSLDSQSSAPHSMDGDAATVAREALREAEQRLAVFVRSEDQSQVEAEHAFDLALARVSDAEPPLNELYEKLEAGLKAATSDRPEALKELEDLDNVIATYRIRVELIERRERREQAS